MEPKEAHGEPGIWSAVLYDQTHGHDPAQGKPGQEATGLLNFIRTDHRWKHVGLKAVD